MLTNAAIKNIVLCLSVVSCRECQARPLAKMHGPIRHSIEITFKVDESQNGQTAWVNYKNNNKVSVWVPDQGLPVNRYNAGSHTLEMWIGYFKHPVGDLLTEYRVPKLHELKPGDTYRLKLLDVNLLKTLTMTHAKVSIMARLNTKDIEYCEVRGGQHFVEYIENSFVVKASMQAVE